ncbi:TPA: hypothetical protein DIC62_00680 [Candidatus Nomurabacteria bacterium]|nr:hypothetical protein [Candidatus Nomurabacteria bacterium]
MKKGQCQQCQICSYSCEDKDLLLKHLEEYHGLRVGFVLENETGVLENEMYLIREGLSSSIEKVIRKMRPYLIKAVNQKYSNYPSNLMNKDDFISIAEISIWESLNCQIENPEIKDKCYKYICPVCGKAFTSMIRYEKHLLVKHGKQISPKVSIGEFVNFRLGVRLQNAVRDEYAQKRQGNHFYSRDDEMSQSLYLDYASERDEDSDFKELDSGINIEDEVSEKFLIEGIIKRLGSSNIDKAIIIQLFRGIKVRKIATKIYNAYGEHSSIKSATTTVKNMIKVLLENGNVFEDGLKIS